MAFRASHRQRKSLHRQKPMQLQLTSLIDIFTVLLLFFLKSLSQEAEFQVTPSETLKLPESIAQKAPEPTVHLIIAQDAILFEGQKVLDLPNGELPPEAVDGFIIKPLLSVLKRRAEQLKTFEQRYKHLPFKGKITLYGDRRIPFSLLKRVMVTAGEAEFGEFRFAVLNQE
ncbi:MAG: hypothetical protein D6812_04185 [Deltaproteobacteria bacterium]|nr:MAG: hypothetical protein D6812_04185 [Deltaproteobacteria bacterium]